MAAFLRVFTKKVTAYPVPITLTLYACCIHMISARPLRLSPRKLLGMLPLLHEEQMTAIL